MVLPVHIDLLRHGETRGGNRFRGRTNDPLTPLGWRQMWQAVVGGRHETVPNPLLEVNNDPDGPSAGRIDRGRMAGESPSPLLEKDYLKRDGEEGFANPGHEDGMAPGHWHAILSSPLSRCADFARALSQYLAIPLQLDARLAEMDFGDWEGRTAADLMALDAESLGRFWADPLAHPPPGGESLQTFQDRVLSFWRGVLGQPPPDQPPAQDQGRDTRQRILVITHGGVIRVILCEVLGWPLARLLELDVGHASLTGIRLDRAQGLTEAHLVSPLR